jgi:hypothetical protein
LTEASFRNDLEKGHSIRFSWGVQMEFNRYSSLLAVVVFVAISAFLPAAAQIQVTSADPAAAPQGTTNLNVTIAGSGFKKGAQAQWFVTGTTNPGGVTVNSTTVNGSSKITANITVANDAVTSGFDILVRNTDGRTGKGTDAFTVTSKGTPVGCWTTGTPSGFTLVTVLNPVQPNGAALITTGKLGNAIRIRALDMNRDGVVDTLVALVTSGAGSPPGTYVFFLDPVTGQVQATNPVTGAAWQNPLQVLSGVRGGHAAAGDVNGDGIPDFAMSMPNDGTAYSFVGSVSGSPSYTPSYSAYQLVPPSGAPTAWGMGIALGDLDGDGKDEVIVGATPGKRDTAIPAVFIYDYTGSGMSFVRKIQDPTGTQGSSFGGELYGNGVAIGNLDGNPGNELVVGAVGGGTSGLVYVFPYPTSQSNYFTLSGPGPQFGEGVGIADVNQDGTPDLVVITGSQFNGSDTTAQALVFPGNVHAGENYTNQLLPATGLAYSWAAPNSDVGEMLASGAVAVGTPNATNASGTSCTMKGGVGAVHLFTSPFASSQQPNYVFEPPTLVGSSQFEFGYGVGVVPGYPFLLVGAHFQDVGTTTNAGQVYVYKLN